MLVNKKSKLFKKKCFIWKENKLGENPPCSVCGSARALTAGRARGIRMWWKPSTFLLQLTHETVFKSVQLTGKALFQLDFLISWTYHWKLLRGRDLFGRRMITRRCSWNEAVEFVHVWKVTLSEPCAVLCFFFNLLLVVPKKKKKDEHTLVVKTWQSEMFEWIGCMFSWKEGGKNFPLEFNDILLADVTFLLRKHERWSHVSWADPVSPFFASFLTGSTADTKGLLCVCFGCVQYLNKRSGSCPRRQCYLRRGL